MSSAYIGATNAEVTISASRSGGTVNFTIPWKVWTDSGWTSQYRKLVVDGTTVMEDQGDSSTKTGRLTRSTTTPSAGTRRVNCTIYGRDASHDGSTSFSVSVNYPAQTFTVTFDAGSGSASETTRSVDYGAAIGTLPTVTTPSGYAFLGWFTEQTGGTQINTTTVCYGNTTYYAQYKPMAILRMVNNGAVTTYTKIYSVGDGSAKQVLSVWSVDETGAHQGI